MFHVARRAVLAILLLAILSGAVSAEAPSGDRSISREAGRVRVVINLVRTRFLEPVNESALVQGALDGLVKALQERKLEAALPVLPDPEPKGSHAFRRFERFFGWAARRHPDLLADGSLARWAISGAVSVLEDPYTAFLTASEYRKLLEGLGGSAFGGIGVYVTSDTRTGTLTCVEPMEDGPAERAGVKPRDVITAVDGVPVSELGLEEAKDRLRGEPGTTVHLTLSRVGVPKPVLVAVVRDLVKVRSVSPRLEEVEGHRVGYLKVRMFGTETGGELALALDDLESQGVEGYVLDLRNNGGGYVVAAIDLLSQFVPRETPLVSVVERDQPERVYRSRGGTRRSRPLVVLVNDHSASASEITAGALQDLKLGTLVGVHTFGKGSVQKVIPLADLSALKITTAHYRTPAGRDIHKEGIEPDLVVEMGAQDIGTARDVQLARALDLVLEKLR